MKAKTFAKYCVKGTLGTIGALFALPLTAIVFVPAFFWNLFKEAIAKNTPAWMCIPKAIGKALTDIPIASFRQSWRYAYSDLNERAAGSSGAYYDSQSYHHPAQGYQEGAPRCAASAPVYSPSGQGSLADLSVLLPVAGAGLFVLGALNDAFTDRRP